MLRTLVTAIAVVGLLVVTGVALADELKGEVASVDKDKMTFTVTVDGKDMTVKFDKDTKFIDAKMKSVESTKLAKKAKVVVTYDKKGDDLLATKVEFQKK